VGSDKVCLGFTKDSVVGCGLILSSRTIFFTLNGRHLGSAFNNVDLGISINLTDDFHLGDDTSLKNTKLYACVCLQTQGEAVKVNFGRTGFCFDIDAFRH
jgi:hypothetical protein